MSQKASGSKKKGLCRCFTLCWKSKKSPTPAEINKKKWKELGYKNEKQTLPPIFTILIDLYDGKDDVYQALEDCRINPDYTPQNHIRNDLDYYIPQLTNFMMLHEDFSNEKLRIFLDGLSKTDPYFAHLYYWYITSLLPDLNEEKAKTILNQLIDICSSISQSHLFVIEYERFCSALERKLFKEDYDSKMKEMHMRRMKVLKMVQAYKGPTAEPPPFEELTLKGSDIELRPYISPFIQGQEAYRSNPFTSTLLFFEDLYVIAEEAIKINDKLPRVKKLLTDLNKALPSCVYIPFVKDWIRHYAILNIVVDETRVFSTKERAPFYVCMELFCPKEELTHEYQEMFKVKEKKQNLISWAKDKLRKATQKLPYHKMDRDPLEEEMDEQFKLSKLNQLVSSPLTLKRGKSSNDPNAIDGHHRGSHAGHSMIVISHTNDIIAEADRLSSPQYKKISLGAHPKRASDERRSSIDLEMVMKRRRSASFHTEAYQHQHHHFILEEHKDCASKEVKIQLNKMGSGTSESFDGAEEEKDGGEIEKMPKKSSGRDNADNAGESTRPNSLTQFKDDFSFFGEDSTAQMERIRKNSPFKDLKSWRLIHLIVKSGADIKEEQFALQLVSQFDQIFQAEKLKLILTPYELVSLGPDIGVMEMLKDAVTLSSLKEKMYRHNIPSLNDFFIQYYGKDVDKARKKFCRSLAAYSLLCYFLQIKDRHNGNIMLHKNGNIMHIDFGFFLSNAPGKGLEFERKVPFKLLNEYIEVLGGSRSRWFQDFRKLFYKGFMAARKHSEQIIILVKMMYSSHRDTLPCFRSGDRAILELERRFFPPNVNEKDLTRYCYNLINQSLDNWRAKCYDKYQYHFQGIFY